MNLFWFELRKLKKNFVFLIVITVFLAIAIMETGEILHYPIKSEADIKYLQNVNAAEFIYVPDTNENISKHSLEYLQRRLDDGSILEKNKVIFTTLTENIEIQGFAKVFDELKNGPAVGNWLMACQQQFGMRIGTIEEINANLSKVVAEEGYNTTFFVRYSAVMQIMAMYLLFPISLALFTKDSRAGMTEIVATQRIGSTKYLMSRFSAMLLPVLFAMYSIGEIFNVISYLRYKELKFNVDYEMFIPQFLLYLLPTVTFLCTLLMFMFLLFKNAIAVLPIYFMYVIYNSTPKLFGGNSIETLSKPILRLDFYFPTAQAIMANRILYMILTATLILLSCRLYSKSLRKMKMVVTV